MIVESELAHGLETLHVPATGDVEKKLLDYVALIRKWNRVYNLTALREPEKMLTHHVLDSVAVAPHLGGRTLLDVGSGAGLPGIPLAVVRPHLHVTLLDSNQKKSAFQQQAVIELALTNLDVVNARVETWNAPQAFEVVVSRAFSDLAEFVAKAARFCATGGVMAAMKGVYPTEEIAHLPDTIDVKVLPLTVPGVDAARHLVLMRLS
jgi:16S rRNA (guanine527-N7)-methyltransferase